MRKLDAQTADEITRYLAERPVVQSDPRVPGSQLTGGWQGLWRFRVGDYRVICDMREQELVILALAIGHRKEVYE